MTSSATWLSPSPQLGTYILMGDAKDTSRGAKSLRAAATLEKSGVSANGQNSVLAASLPSPGIPSAFGLSF